MHKINQIEVNGNNNIVIQDISGNSKIYINSDAGAKELYEDFKKEVFELRLLLKQRQEPVLQQFAEKIYNIANIENANFYGEGRITIEKAGKISFERKTLTEKQQEHLELLENLETRYKNRLKEKMKTELLFQLELNLEYTKEGTNETYLKDYYTDSYEEKSAESFERLFRDYEKTLKRLLILGEVGSGKTVLLLKFALQLITEAKQDFNYPLPIFLSLATWRDEKQNFETWIEENLVAQFSFSKREAKKLAIANNFLLLLDGLDEIPENDRTSCLEKMRAYLESIEKAQTAAKHYPSAIISSRKQEYFDLHTQAPVRATIQVADLTPEKICEELERLKQAQSTNAKILLNRITENPSIAPKLKSAFEVHLALNMAQSFDFSQLSTENLVEAYLNQEIKKLEPEYPKARHYLSFLAKKMRENKKGLIFDLLSDLQINWLEKINNFEVVRYIFMIISISCFTLLNNQKITKHNDYNNIIVAYSFLFIMPVLATMGVTLFVELYQLAKKRGINVKILYIIPIIFLVVFLITSLAESFEDFLQSIFLVLFYYISIEVWFKDFKIDFTEKNPYLRFYYNYRKFLVIYVCLVLAHDFILDAGISLFSFIKIGIIILISLVPIISHFILRFFLFIDNKIPFRYRTFLNKVSGTPDIKDKKGNIIKKGIEGTGILEKDGGQWRFRHQLLQDALGKCGE